MIRYESNTETMRSIQNDLIKFDRSLSNTLRSDRVVVVEKNGNENMENNRRIQDVGTLLTCEGVSLSGTLSRKLSNYDNARKMNNEGTLTRRIRDDASDISSSSMSGRGNH